VARRYKVEIERSADKFLKKLGGREEQRIRDKIAALAHDPRPPEAIPLKPSDSWRIVMRPFRVIYIIEDVIRVVTVTRVANRDHVYKDRS
jgi:mRNA interferase RelE/StbE